MIKKMLQITGLLITFLVTMSITINNKPIFSHIYDVISPATIYSQNKTRELMTLFLTGTKVYTNRIFTNSVPKMKDSVKSTLSSQKKRGEPEEQILDNEKAELDQLIKNR